MVGTQFPRFNNITRNGQITLEVWDGICAAVYVQLSHTGICKALSMFEHVDVIGEVALECTSGHGRFS